MIRGVIELFECDIATIKVDNHTIEYPKHLLPIDAQVGDIVLIEGNKITLDKEATDAYKREADEAGRTEV